MYLYFFSTSTINYACIQVLSSFGNQLQELDFTGSILHEESLCLLCKNCMKLVKLNLSDCQISSNTLKYIQYYLKSLELLITDEILE